MKNLDVPPFWLLVFLVMNVVLDTIAGVLRFGSGLTDIAGFIVVGLAIAIFISATMWFRRKDTTINPHGSPTVLIVEGPFKYSRNPIYLSMAALLLGEAILLGSTLPVLMVYLYARLISVRFIAVEEERLRQAFGDEADAYFAKTKRWF
jgi:protein-S-isoprenylcysteine O-methyltransferase Ste14